MKQTKKSKLAGVLGPGLMMAAAAIGVSHLVQSTRAGAEYGFALLWAVLLANLFKYPFLEFGPRYTVAKKESLIEGYRRLGSYAILVFFVFTIGTMFAAQAAVTIVTASLAAEMTGLSLTPVIWSAFLLIISILILISDKYSLLDNIVKILMSILAISTIIAVGAALFQGEYQTLSRVPSPDIWSVTGVGFIIALMGWMPIPVDASAWHSLWAIEKNKLNGRDSSLQDTLLDFNIGYIGAALLAVFFLVLGAVIMFGSGVDFASSSSAFSTQLIQLYTSSLGNWAYPVIIICAFTTMFSTTLFVTDAYPRVCRKFIQMYKPTFLNGNNSIIYRFFLVVVSILSLSLLALLGDQFRYLVDLATTLSFLSAPVLAWLNHKLMHMHYIPSDCRPPLWLTWLSRAGILFLTAFALIFAYWMVRF